MNSTHHLLNVSFSGISLLFRTSHQESVAGAILQRRPMCWVSFADPPIESRRLLDVCGALGKAYPDTAHCTVSVRSTSSHEFLTGYKYFAALQLGYRGNCCEADQIAPLVVSDSWHL